MTIAMVLSGAYERESGMSKLQEGTAVNAERVRREVHRLSSKIADQVDKGQWWNAMAYATELVAACQQGCRAEIERVVKNRSGRNESGAAKKKATKKKAAKKK
jgi:hypothetical protein